MPLISPARAHLRAATAVAVFAALAVTPFAAARVDTSANPVEIVVGFEDAASSAERLDALAEAGVRIEETLPKLNAVVVSAPDAKAAAALAELRAEGDVEYAAREVYLAPALVPNDPGYATSSWPYLQTALPNAWDLTTGNSAVVVAVLDSGVDASHPDLPAMAAGYDFVNDDADPADDIGHGTQVTGALAARMGNGTGGVGACPGCTVMPIKVIDVVTGLATDSDVVAGIVWATDNGADVINMSLGGPDASQLLVDGVAYARARGVIVIASAGNDGTPIPMYPSAIEGVIGVAASDSNDALYPFSNRGASIVDLAAPGCLQTTISGGATAEACGTSIAAPFAAGVAGLVLSHNPLLNGKQVEDVLTSSARDEPGLDVEHGILDAYVALLVAASMPAPPVNTALPEISGAAQEGEVLTATTGSWSDGAISYSYAWERCNASAVVCGPVTDATGSGYTLSGADVGLMLRVVVTATNGGGAETSATSAKTAVVGGVAALPPGYTTDVFATLAASSTSPALGSTVDFHVAIGARPGSAPASKVVLDFTLPSGLVSAGSTASKGAGCTVKGQRITCDLGALSYPAGAAVDVSATVRMSGKLTALASVTTVPGDARPDDNMVTKTVAVVGPDTPTSPKRPVRNPPAGDDDEPVTVKPVSIGGSARVGKRLIARPGSGWAGKAPHRFRFQWQSCATVKGKLRCGSLKGKTGRTFVVRRANVGKRLRVQATGVSADGKSQRRTSPITVAVRR